LSILISEELIFQFNCAVFQSTTLALKMAALNTKWQLLNEGKSAANFCRQLAPFFHDMFCDF